MTRSNVKLRLKYAISDPYILEFEEEEMERKIEIKAKKEYRKENGKPNKNYSKRNLQQISRYDSWLF
jgi:hypothetical protein